jgi:putative MATE family efflux protein
MNEPAGRSGQNGNSAKFVTGSTMRHVVVMTSTGSIGLMAIFVVDFLNLFYISLLGEQELAAAIGYAGSVLAFNIAIGIGMTIAATALISRALGAENRDHARHMSASALAFIMLVSLLVVIGLWPFIPLALDGLGASGHTKEIATGFLRIVVPSLPLLGLGMVFSGILRAVGDARRAMYVTLAGGVASAIFDPLFIFGFDLGVTGAAVATVLSRCVLVGVGLYGAVRVHDMIGRLDLARFKRDLRAMSGIAVPAVLTNIATPVGNAYLTATISRFGDDAVAGWAIIGRIIPVAFGTIFALSGAVGPIIGQNFWRRPCRPGASDAEGCADFHASLHRGGLDPACSAAPSDRRHFRCQGRSGRACALLLRARCRLFRLLRRIVRRQCGLQQSRISDLFDRVQLGPGDAWNDPLRLVRRSAIRRSGRACRLGGGWHRLRLRCGGHGVSRHRNARLGGRERRWTGDRPPRRFTVFIRQESYQLTVFSSSRTPGPWIAA